MKWNLIAIAMVGVFLLHCNTGTVVAPKDGNLKVMANYVDKTCKSLSTERIWTAFYGTLPITNPSNSVALPKNKGYLQYREYYSGMDSFSSIFLGFFTTITTRTRVIEACGSPTVIKREEPSMQISEEEKPFLNNSNSGSSRSPYSVERDTSPTNRVPQNEPSRQNQEIPESKNLFNPIPGELR